MQTVYKEILNENEFYENTIKYIFFSPEVFVTSSYLSDIKSNMENRLINEDLEIEELLYIKFIVGLCIYKSNDFFSSNNIFESLCGELDLKCNPFITPYLYTILSISYLNVKNIDQHIKYYELAINYLKSTDLKELLLFLHINTSLTKLEIFKTDELLYSNINNSLKILTSYDGLYSSQALIHIGYIYQKYLYLPNIALDLFDKSLSMCKANKENDINLLAKYNIGCTYIDTGKISQGIDILNNILKNNSNILPSIFKINIYCKILSSLYKINFNFEEIKGLLDEYKNNLYNIDSYYMDTYLARYNLIVTHYALLENNTSFSKKSLSDLFYYLDNANYIYKSNFSKFAFIDFEYWLEISYGNLYFSLCNYEKALIHHKKALLFSHKPHSKENTNLYKLISNDYEKISNYKEALKYYKIYIDTLDNYNKINTNDLYVKLFEEYNKKIVFNSVNSNFFSNLSHELKTPVNIIYSSVQLMGSLKDKDQTSLKEYFNKYEKSVKQNCLRMLRLINNLIDITKIDSGMTKLDLVLVDIVPFVEDLTLSIIPYTKFKNLNITFDTNVEKLYLRIDTYAFERIILNLLSNAIKFNNSNGNIIVTIESHDNKVTISIKDTGIGIPEGYADLIFSRFYKIDNSFSRRNEGSGIGLSITKNLVELQGGKISFNENYKEGSEFIITFPKAYEIGIYTDNNYKYYVDDEKILSELSDIYELF